MTLHGVAATGQAAPTQQTAEPTGLGTKTAKAAPAFGSAPAVSVTISAKAQAQAKLYAIQHGHDPDGVQDGK